LYKRGLTILFFYFIYMGLLNLKTTEMTTRLNFSFQTERLTEKQVEQIYKNNPEINDPFYQKGILWKSESDLVEMHWFILTINNETYLCKSDPALEDEWYKVTGYR
jgi:uncharacterized membrane protein